MIAQCLKISMVVSKFNPIPFDPTQGVKSNVQISPQLRQLSIFFAEILRAGRAAIDMKHVKLDFSFKAWVRAPGVDLEDGAEAKIKLFQNMVMLLI